MKTPRQSCLCQSHQVAQAAVKVLGFGPCARGTSVARVADMLPVAPKKIFRDALIGFGIGLVVMLGFSYALSTFAGSPTAAATSHQ